MNAIDEVWKAEVRKYVKAGLGFDPKSEAFRNLSGYLWQDTTTYKRLAETPEGKFWREVDNPCPDYLLRSLYRGQLLESK